MEIVKVPRVIETVKIKPRDSPDQVAEYRHRCYKSAIGISPMSRVNHGGQSMSRILTLTPLRLNVKVWNNINCRFLHPYMVVVTKFITMRIWRLLLFLIMFLHYQIVITRRTYRIVALLVTLRLGQFRETDVLGISRNQLVS